MNLSLSRIPLFNEFLLESAKVPRVVAIVNTELDGHKSPPMKLIEKSFNKYFDRIMLDQIKKPFGAVPIINYTKDSNDIVKKMIRDGLIDKKNLYNQPELKELTGDKKKFHEVFDKSQDVPKTVFSLEEAKKLKFPIIAKPSNGHSGEGIMKFDKPGDIKGKFDLYSEMIKIDKEYRIFCFRDKILTVDRRDDKSEGDFMKKSDTTTEFVYLKQEESTFKNFQSIVDESYAKIPLDFFSVDVAEDEDGKMWIIEMNSSTGMGVEKLVKLYKEICKDFYGEVPKELEDQMKTDVENYQEVYKTTRIDECTTVAARLNGTVYLFKNRDRSFTPENKIVHERIDGVEVAYYTDQTGWVEGMNEHGLGFVFSSNEGSDYEGYDRTYTVSDDPKGESKFKPFAKEFKSLLTSKTLEEAMEKLEKQKKSGNFLISNGRRTFEFERFDKESKSKKLVLRPGQYYVKTNHGKLIPQAGHQYHPKKVRRASSDLRKVQAELQLTGIKDPMEIAPRMQFQHFDPKSSLNTFRTDAEEYTISQCLMMLRDRELHFFHHKETADSISLDDKMTGEERIKIVIHKG